MPPALRLDLPEHFIYIDEHLLASITHLGYAYLEGEAFAGIGNKFDNLIMGRMETTSSAD